MEVWSFFLHFVILILESVPEAEGVFSSELGSHYDKAFQSMPLEIGIPWEFNRTIKANETAKIRTSFEDGTMFAVIQVHSFVYNVSVLYGQNETISGTNTGFVAFLDLVDNMVFSVYNPNSKSVEVLGYITPHGKFDPVPGAFVSSVGMIKPTISLTVSKNLVNVSIQPAVEVFVENGTCSATTIKYRLFYLYTTEKDYSIATYFEGIRAMANSERMMEEAFMYKQQLLYKENTTEINVLFANYPGTGIIFNIISETVNGSSMYVSAHTFGCNYTDKTPPCIYLENTSHKVEMMVLCAAGLILCFCGYEWRSFELYIMVFLLIGLSSYTIFYNLFSLEDNILISLFFAFSGSTVLVTCIICFNCVLVRHTTSFYVFGVLIASCLVYYTDIDNYAPFKCGYLYWTAFIAFVLLCVLVLYMNSTVSHFVTTSVVGSFMAVITVDYFADTSLKFILFDNIRRLSVNDFCQANSSPPFQTPEVVLSVLWFTIAVASFIYQYCGRCFFCDADEEDSPVAQTPRVYPTGLVDVLSNLNYVVIDDTCPLLDPDTYQRWPIPPHDHFD